MTDNAIDATVGIVLTGEDISPGKVPAREIAEVVEAVEEMRASTIARDRSEASCWL